MFPIEQVVWADESGAPVNRQPPQLSRFRRPKGSALQRIVEWEAEGMSGLCPACGKRLPSEVWERDTLVIGLVGERGAAKSHYLAALVKELTESAVLEPFNVIVDLAPECAEQVNRVYLDPLFTRRKRLEATLPIVAADDVREPVMLILRNIETSRAVNLLLYDASGEQLHNPADHARYNKFLYLADGVMLFVTPSSLRELRPKIDTDPNSTQSVAKSTAMFNALAGQLRKSKGLGDESDLDSVATAVVLTKADQLRSIAPADGGTWLEELLGGQMPKVRVPGPALRSQMEEESKRVAELIYQSGGQNIVATVAHRFTQVSFHAVAATGCNPEQDTFPFVRPVNCLGPLLALLIAFDVVSPTAGHVSEGWRGR